MLLVKRVGFIDLVERVSPDHGADANHHRKSRGLLREKTLSIGRSRFFCRPLTESAFPKPRNTTVALSHARVTHCLLALDVSRCMEPKEE